MSSHCSLPFVLIEYELAGEAYVLNQANCL